MTALHAPRCPPVIVLMGIAGAGKTTVGQALAAALGRDFHDADDYHLPESIAAMRRGEPLTDTGRAPWLAALRALIARCAAEGPPIVLACSALRASYRAALAPPSQVPGAVAFVHLRLSPELARQRLAARPGHFMPVSLVASQVATLEEPPEGLQLDAALPVPELVAQVRRTLGC
jgi:gluconokinase